MWRSYVQINNYSIIIQIIQSLISATMLHFKLSYPRTHAPPRTEKQDCGEEPGYEAKLTIIEHLTTARTIRTCFIDIYQRVPATW